MAVYNGEAYLRECVDSVFSQTYGDFEFLVIDDGSVDLTSDILRSYKDKRMRLVRNDRNISQVASLNVGLRQALGEYVVRIDADDMMLSGRIERQLDFLSRRPDVALVGSRGEAIDEKGRLILKNKIPLRREEIIANIITAGFVSVHSSFMFRKDAVLDVGGYNEDFSFTEDFKLIIDLLIRGYHVNNMRDVLIRYRFHDDRISVRSKSPQTARAITALKGFIRYFTKGLSDADRDALSGFLVSAGSMDKDYLKGLSSRADTKKNILMSEFLLKNISSVLAFRGAERYFMKKVFCNKMLNFAYQASGIKEDAGVELYKYCLRNCLFIPERPKLYLYPLRAGLRRLRVKGGQ